MSNNVGSISHNQGHEVILQIEKALKRLQQSSNDFTISRLIREKFFEQVTIQYELDLYQTFNVGIFFGENRLDISPIQMSYSFMKLVKRYQYNHIKVQRPSKIISRYQLPDSFNPLTLKHVIGAECDTEPMDEEDFWLVVFSLVINRELGKRNLGFSIESGVYYFLRFKASEKQTYEVGIEYHDNKYKLNAWVFNKKSVIEYAKNAVFIF